MAGGAYTHVAQVMMAFQLGGAAFTHGVVEGKSFLQGQIPIVAFFSTTVAVQTLNGKLMLPQALLTHTVALACGFATGYAIVAMGKGGPKAAQALSPVKWRNKRGF